MALEDEGQGLLEKLGYEVVYCGIGKVNATYHLMRRLADSAHPVQHVLNLGSAGSHYFKTGEVVEAYRFVQRDMDLTGLGFALGHTPYESDPMQVEVAPLFPELATGVCGSGDSFLQDRCPVNSQIIDMEAYALAKVCAREQIRFNCVKYITDGADHAASSDWQTNLNRAAHAFEALLSKQS